jgi:hypothetical protein
MTTHTLALPLGGPNLATGLKRRVYWCSARTVWILVTTPVAGMMDSLMACEMIKIIQKLGVASARDFTTGTNARASSYTRRFKISRRSRFQD